MLIVLSILAAFILLVVLFINFSPEFGGKPSKADKARFETSGHYSEGIFVNEIETSLDMSAGSMWKTLREFMSSGVQRRPEHVLPQEFVDSTSIANYQGPSRLIWFGHSAFLLQMDGQTILIDPMLGKVPAPHPWLGGKRFNEDLPIILEKLPQIDAVIISHDHYDHLDYGSIKKLKEKTKKFLVPLGVGAHLKEWGISENAYQEFNWWDETQVGPIRFVFCPSRHFSGRGLTDRSTTLWGSWVMIGGKEKLYFSGDSGYGPHFKRIGEKFGPFDLALMECGQYNEKWATIHMMPEETAIAGREVQANAIVPIHWGAFSLAPHEWTDPIVRVQKKALELDLPLRTPRIGASFLVNDVNPHLDNWWLRNGKPL